VAIFQVMKIGISPGVNANGQWVVTAYQNGTLQPGQVLAHFVAQSTGVET